MLKLTDSHCHLDFKEFSATLPETLAQCASLGISRIIVPSINQSNWQQVLDLNSFNSAELTIFPCLGLHPWFLEDADSNTIEVLSHCISQNLDKIIAIGEAGIDGSIALEKDNLFQQVSIFEQQLELAEYFNLPIIVHHRRSYPEVYRALKQAKISKGGIVHAFSGSYQQAKHYIDLGFKLGIGGTITYERASKTIETVKKVPLDALVLETDAPAMPLAGFQGQANHPSRIVDVLDTLAEIRSEPKHTIAQQTEQNIDALFFN